MMMMKKKVVAPVERVVFALNGERQEVSAADVDPSTTLLEFIRTRTPFKGPKLGCGEASYTSTKSAIGIGWETSIGAGFPNRYLLIGTDAKRNRCRFLNRHL
uniref:Uncharacterized protein n=1 Tax=Oryza punctata TaxID=4537 RepID=A0A0E0LJD1_ORYPU